MSRRLTGLSPNSIRTHALTQPPGLNRLLILASALRRHTQRDSEAAYSVPGSKRWIDDSSVNFTGFLRAHLLAFLQKFTVEFPERKLGRERIRYRYPSPGTSPLTQDFRAPARLTGSSVTSSIHTVSEQLLTRVAETESLQFSREEGGPPWSTLFRMYPCNSCSKTSPTSLV